MADIQRGGARKLLALISALPNGEFLTYQQAARGMGRPASHSRAIAKMCNLLDAAACLAGVPALALARVREKSGEINSKAWEKEYGPGRTAIINRSKRYQFSTSDYDAIRNAIDDLGQRGDIAAWRYVERLYGGFLYRRLTGDDGNSALNAIDDLGTDTPDRAKIEAWSYTRDPGVRAAVLRRANGKCEFCGELGFMKSDGTRYLESHHVIALCPNDHREAHFGQRCKEIEQEMIQKLKAMNI